MTDKQPDLRQPKQLFMTSLRMGLGFGLAIALVHLAHGIGLLVALRQPPLTVMAIQSFVMEIALALPIAFLLCPFLLMPQWRWLHPLGMVVIFIIMERWVAVDPSKLPMWIAPSLIGGLVFAIGRRIWAKKPAYALGTAAVLVVVLLLIPIIRHAMSTEAEVIAHQERLQKGHQMFWSL